MPTQNPFTATEQSNAQREYMAATAKNYQNEADLYSLLTDADSKLINKKGLKQPIELSANPSLAAANIDGGATPTIGSRDLDNFVVNYAVLTQGRGNTYEELLNNNKETAEDEVMASLKSDLKQQIKFINDYVSRGDGTWALGIVSAYTNPSTTVTLNTTGDTIGPSQLLVGQYVTFWNAAGTTQRTGTVGAGAIKILSKTATTIVLESNAPSDVVATDIIVPEIGVTNAATGALAGLPYIIDDANTYFGKARGSVTQLQAYVKAAGGALTVAMLMEAYASVKQRGGYGFGTAQELIDALWMVLGITQYQNYYNLSLSSGAIVGSPHQFNHNTSAPKFDYGFSGIDSTWFGAPMKVCNSVRGDEIYFLNPKELQRAVLKPVGAIGDDFPDKVMLTNSSGYPLYTLASYADFVGNIYSPRPFRLGKIKTITVTGLVQQRNVIS